jgi:hypothetical protein
MRQSLAGFSQVSIGSAPDGTGRYVAFLEGTPELFSQILGISFERIRDHLDDLDAAQICTESGVYALLGFYINAPKKGMDIYISEKSKSPKQDLEEVLEAISGGGARIIWREPNI